MFSECGGGAGVKKKNEHGENVHIVSIMYQSCWCRRILQHGKSKSLRILKNLPVKIHFAAFNWSVWRKNQLVNVNSTWFPVKGFGRLRVKLFCMLPCRTILSSSRVSSFWTCFFFCCAIKMLYGVGMYSNNLVCPPSVRFHVILSIKSNQIKSNNEEDRFWRRNGRQCTELAKRASKRSFFKTSTSKIPPEELVDEVAGEREAWASLPKSPPGQPDPR